MVLRTLLEDANERNTLAQYSSHAARRTRLRATYESLEISV